jgi:hypothetical protein
MIYLENILSIITIRTCYIDDLEEKGNVFFLNKNIVKSIFTINYLDFKFRMNP